MPICVKSEIGPLKRVLLQRPGRELEHLSPNTMGQLLFDDIPYLYGAQREHDCFAQILRDNGAEVVYLEDLTAQVLASDEVLRRQFVAETIRRAGSTAMGYRADLERYLLDIQDPLLLVLKTMEGVSYQDVFPNEQGRLSSLVHTGVRFLMPPIPNLYFTRDPFACIGRGVSLNHMFTATRNRETLYGDYVLRHHPDYADRVQLIRCGGSSQIAAEREQWNDGSNTLCIAPGVAVVYDRNYVTNQILEDSGIRVLKMPSAELSRGRGGPRCMSMPLWRDGI